MPTRGVYNQLINYNVVINIINKYIGQEWKNQMRCNIVYTKPKSGRVGQKSQPAGNTNWFLKKKRNGRSGTREPRTVRLLAKSAYASLASHAFGIEPYAYHITKERTSRQKLPTGFKKGVKWTLWDSNPGPSGYEPDALTNWAKRPKCNYIQLL